MDKPLLLLTLVEPDRPFGEFYTDDDLKFFGYTLNIDGEKQFNEERVLVSFRVRFKDQSFPLRIQFRKDEAGEDDWIRHAREKARLMLVALGAGLAGEAPGQ